MTVTRWAYLIYGSLLLGVGCTHPAPPATSSGAGASLLLGSVDNVAICRAPVAGWSELSAQQHRYAYELARAAHPGRDVYYDQIHRDGLALRGLLEGIVSTPGKTDPAVLEKIRHDLRLMWVDSGVYDGHSGEKRLASFSRDELVSAAKEAAAAGATFDPDGRPGVSDPMPIVERVSPLLFDPSFDPLKTARAPVDGKDIVQASAVNFYERGLTLAQVDALHGTHGLDSTIVRGAGGAPAEDVWKVGGRYGAQLSESVDWLTKAKADAPPEDQPVLDGLIRYYRSGDPADFHDYSVAWVKTSPVIETIQGFIEVYDDPRAEKASYEGYVFTPDVDASRRMQALAADVLYLEGKEPWSDTYKKTEIHPPVARAFQLLAAYGAGGRTLPVGINLPNAQDIRQTYGTKSFYLSNEDACVNAVSTMSSVKEFAPADERDAIEPYAARAWQSLVALHEIAGHGSGKVSPKLTQDPSHYLREYYSAMEEGRADLVALWNIGDQKLIADGVVESPKTRRAAYEQYAMGVLAQLRRAPTGDTLGEDHLRARQMIVKFAEAKGAVRLVVEGGKHYYRLTSEDAFRQAVGELLSEVMRAKAEGDYDAAKKLVETYGVHFDPALRDEVVARAKAAGIPTTFVDVLPRMVPVRDAGGALVDVTLAEEPSWDTANLRADGRLPE